MSMARELMASGCASSTSPPTAQGHQRVAALVREGARVSRMLEEAVYGPPEMHREAIRQARIVGCPVATRPLYSSDSSLSWSAASSMPIT
jgi:hypothetical protein